MAAFGGASQGPHMSHTLSPYDTRLDPRCWPQSIQPDELHFETGQPEARVAGAGRSPAAARVSQGLAGGSEVHPSGSKGWGQEQNRMAFRLHPAGGPRLAGDPEAGGWPGAPVGCAGPGDCRAVARELEGIVQAAERTVTLSALSSSLTEQATQSAGADLGQNPVLPH